MQLLITFQQEIFQFVYILFVFSKSKQGVRKLEEDIVVTKLQILNSNIAATTTHTQSNTVSSVEPPKENKSSTQFGEYVPSIQQWEDKSKTKATRPPTCNC